MKKINNRYLGAIVRSFISTSVVGVGIHLYEFISKDIFSNNKVVLLTICFLVMAFTYLKLSKKEA